MSAAFRLPTRFGPEGQLTSALLTETVRLINVGKGRTARVRYPAGYGAEQPFE